MFHEFAFWKRKCHFDIFIPYVLVPYFIKNQRWWNRVVMFSPRQSSNENELLQTRQQTAPKAGPIQKKQNISHLSICLLLGNSIYRLAYNKRAQIFSRARSASGRFFMFSAAKSNQRAKPRRSRWGQLPEPEMRSEGLWESLFYILAVVTLQTFT